MWQRDGQTCNVQFVYDGDGNRLLKMEGGTELEITTYYAGQMFEKQFNTTASQLGEGALTNANCSRGANGMTDYGFTGQRHETGFGLMDFNARYYSPRLGRFVSPDSIMSDPATSRGLNRYMYGNGNPLGYTDPSGHCGVNVDGSRDTSTNDATECWRLADIVYGVYDVNQCAVGCSGDIPWGENLFQMDKETWQEQYAYNAGITTNVMAYFVDKAFSDLNMSGNHAQVAWNEASNPKVWGPGQGLAQTVVNDVIECSQSIADCGKALDDTATALSATAVGCAATGLDPCAAGASLASTAFSVVGVGLTVYDAYANKPREATTTDVLMSVGTTYGGYRYGSKAGYAVGLTLSVAQWVWDH